MAEINAHGLIKPKPFTTNDMDGEPITVIISRMPASVGREVLTQYPLTALPKIGDYVRNEELAYKLISYCMVDSNGTPIRLTSKALADNHLRDAETQLRVEIAMMEYNSTFLRSGKASSFFDECLAMLLEKISGMSIRSSQPSSEQNSPPSTNSGQSTT